MSRIVNEALDACALQADARRKSIEQFTFTEKIDPSHKLSNWNVGGQCKCLTEQAAAAECHAIIVASEKAFANLQPS